MLRFFFKVSDYLFPRLGATLAYRFLSNPQVRKLRDFEEQILDQAEQLEVEFRRFTLHGYQWGRTGQPVALLIHGWEGQIGNFGAVVDKFVDKGYCVIGFDGPAHGKSSKGSTTMFEYADFVESIVYRYQPKVLVTHSFGTVSAVFMLNANKDLNIDQWFIITTPSDFKDRINVVKDQIGMGDRTLAQLLIKLEKSTGHKIDDMNMKVMAPKINQVDQVLIIHSKTDKITPIEDARTTHKALRHSELIELDGLGHYNILWSKEVQEILQSRIRIANPLTQVS